MSTTAPALRGTASRTFRSFRNHNYKLYVAGQTVSFVGNWMQNVAQGWLVLQLTHGDGSALGLVVAASSLPMLLFGPWFGVVADRFDRRRVMYIDAAVSGVLAIGLAAVVQFGTVQVWMVVVFAFVFGCINALDVPARRTFITEIVDRDQVTNAISLATSIAMISRMAGPAIAGATIAAFGVPACFLLNGVSYIAVIVTVMLMRSSEIHPGPVVARAPGQVREGLRHVWENPDLRLALLMLVAISTLAFNWQVSVALLAKNVLHAGPGGFGALFAVQGFGAMFGGLFVAHYSHPSRKLLVGSAAVFGVVTLITAFATSFAMAMILMIPAGITSTVFYTMCSVICQTSAAPEMRGRVLALNTVAFQGTRPIGSPILGFVADTMGGRAAFALGGIVSILAAAAAPLIVGIGSPREHEKPALTWE